jgi:hypothetical protein
MVQPTTVLRPPGVRVAPGPVPPGQGANPALDLPVVFGPFDYFLALDVPVCAPSAAANLLGKRLRVRLYLDGPAWPADAQLSLHVWPTLDQAAVPLIVGPPGSWIQYGGIIQPATEAKVDAGALVDASAARSAYAQVGTLTFSFTYSGTAAWQGTIWIDDLIVEDN